ncbi:hypothetical protein ACFX13_033141 [Malus domestica]
MEIEVLLALKGPAKEDVKYLILTEPVRAYIARGMLGRHRLYVFDHYKMVKIHHHPFVILSPAFVAALALQG